MSLARERLRLPPEEVAKLSEPELERYLARLEEADDPGRSEPLQEATPEEVEALIQRLRSKPVVPIDASGSVDAITDAIYASLSSDLAKVLAEPDDEDEDEELAKQLGIDR